MRNRKVILGALGALGLLLRAAFAFDGGIWADEGFLVSIINLPSWKEMIEFLRFHESHPPLFYVLTRSWVEITGHGDFAMMSLPVLIGAAIVPVTYVSVKKLSTPRAALLAAGLVALGPALVEYSSQLRPYGLLQILTLLSTASFVRLLERDRNSEAFAYATWTVLLLYSHNWSWLVLGSHGLAAIYVILKRRDLNRYAMLRRLALALVIIAIAFLPWLTTLAFQVGHAGHQAVAIHGLGEAAGVVLFAVLVGPQMMIFGTLQEDMFQGVVVAAGCALIVSTAVALMMRRSSSNGVQGEEEHRVGPSESRTSTTLDSPSVLRVLVIVSGSPLLVAGILAYKTNLLIGWCISMLAPLALSALAIWADRHWYKPGTRDKRVPLAAGVVALVLVMSTFALIRTYESPRSNTREVARAVERNAASNDLLIVIPEWYAPAFNHYFPASIEQIDYPYRGRATTVDFSNVTQRTLDTIPLVTTRERIIHARAAGRRVWLITEIKYIRQLNVTEMADASRPGHTHLTLTLRVAEIRAALQSSYGPGDRSITPAGPKSRYAQLVVELYAPQPWPRQASVSANQSRPEPAHIRIH